MNTGIPGRIIELITKNMVGELSATERAELDQWLNSSEQNRLFFSQIENRSELRNKWKDYNESDVDQQWRRLAGDIPEINMAVAAKSRIYRWSRFTIAAAVISIVSVTGWYFLTKNTTRRHEQKVSVASTQTDVAPGGNKAVLTLADGTKIVLDNAQNGSLVRQGGTAILKQQDEVTYKQDQSTASKEVLYNTISTPRGGQYHVILPDGSSVWLNAASSIHFPTQFNGEERKVELAGEAYFEVTKDKTKPFRVSVLHATGGSEGAPAEIEVLGTHFNVNAYPDENYINTTLLEGSVRFTANTNNQKTNSNILSPGQQAVLNKDAEKISVLTKEDPDADIAWVNGKFSFDNVSFSTMMRSLSRWYDVAIEYEGPVPSNTIVGEVDRTIPLSKLLAIIEKMGNTHFKIEGRTVKVIP